MRQFDSFEQATAAGFCPLWDHRLRLIFRQLRNELALLSTDGENWWLRRAAEDDPGQRAVFAREVDAARAFALLALLKEPGLVVRAMQLDSYYPNLYEALEATVRLHGIDAARPLLELPKEPASCDD